MCQLFASSGRAEFCLRFAWEAFAHRGSEDGGNPDGWGVAYYADRDAAVYREPEPAASSPMVQFLSRHAPRSRAVISHVRRATQGDRTLENTQPFRRVLGRRLHVFAHNGFVADPGSPPSAPHLQAVGQTDSEQLFLALLAQLEPLWSDTTRVPTLERRHAVIESFASNMRERGAVNFLYFDGETLFAHAHRRTIAGASVCRAPGLYLLERTASTSDPAAPRCVGLDCDGFDGPHAFVATVPLDDSCWVALRAGEIACIENGKRVQ